MFFLVPAIVALVAQTTPWHLDRLDQPHGIDHAPYIPPTPHPVPPPILYVLDTGLSTHSLLQNLTLLPGVNFIDDAPTSDCQGHGTHVTALAVGLAGVAQMPVTVIPLKILNCLGIGLCSTTLSALQWIHARHTVSKTAAIALMSVGSRAAECRAVAMAANALSDAGVLVVAAAGNSATDACAFHPASAKAVLTVSAMRLASGIDNVWNRSNFGSCVDIFAPGVDVLSAWPANRTAVKMLSGTSMAAPLVAGQALLIIATVPSATPAQIRAVILHAATRDSLTGTHIDPDAPGSRVAHVPWLTTSTPASHFGTHTKTGAVINLFLSVPVSRPPMRLALDSVASSLHVALSRLSDARPGVRCDVAHAKASDGSGDVNLVCNVTSRRAYVKEVNEVVVEAFRRGAVRDVFERNVVLVLPPVVSTRGGVGALSVAGVVGIAVGVAVVVVIVVAVVCVAGVGRGRKKREEEV